MCIRDRNLSFGLNGEDNEFLYQSFEKNNDDIQYYITCLLYTSIIKKYKIQVYT